MIALNLSKKSHQVCPPPVSHRISSAHEDPRCDPDSQSDCGASESVLRLDDVEPLSGWQVPLRHLQMQSPLDKAGTYAVKLSVRQRPSRDPKCPCCTKPVRLMRETWSARARGGVMCSGVRLRKRAMLSEVIAPVDAGRWISCERWWALGAVGLGAVTRLRLGGHMQHG